MRSFAVKAQIRIVYWVLVLEVSHLARVKLAVAPPESAEPRIIIFFYCLITF